MKGAIGSIVVLVSLALLFVAERIVGEGGARTVLLWVGLLGVVGAVGWRIVKLQRAADAARPVEARLLSAYVGVIVALGLYAGTTEWGLDLLALEGDAAARTEGALAALWPAVLAVSLAGLLFMELAYRRMPVAEAVEIRRVRTAAYSGLSLALSLVFLFSINYVGIKRDVKEDLSYFKTTKPSESSRQMVKALGEEIRVLLMYPKVNEVLDEVRPYFKDLDKVSGLFEVEVRDHALAPDLARKHRIRDNGVVVLLKGKGDEQQAEQFEVGMELEIARSRLRTLDGRFQKAFSRLTRQRRELHVTAGHEERTGSGIHVDSPLEKTTELMNALSRSNIQTRNLGISQGLANQVPEGAPAVAVIGPRKPFLPEEAQSLLRYVQQGGRLVIMVDPDVDHGLDPLLHGLGVKLSEGTLASERQHLRRTMSLADRGTVFSNDFSAHPTVTLASRNATRVATVFLEGGAVERYEGDGALEGAKVVFPVQTAKDFWLERDGDWEKDDGEPTEKMNMMAAITIPQGEGEEGRAVVIPDGDFVTDQVIRNAGNALVFGDILNWLIGEEQIVGDTTSEEDVRIEHTRDEDKVWFFATSFGVPLPILGVGVWMTLRRRRRRETHRRNVDGPGAAPGAGGGASLAETLDAGAAAEDGGREGDSDAGEDDTEAKA